VKNIAVHTWYSALVIAFTEHQSLQGTFEQIIYIFRVVTFEITHIQGGVQRPTRAIVIIHFTNRSISTGDYIGAVTLGSIM
jgi:hypothetical protein